MRGNYKTWASDLSFWISTQSYTKYQKNDFREFLTNVQAASFKVQDWEQFNHCKKWLMIIDGELDLVWDTDENDQAIAYWFSTKQIYGKKETELPLDFKTGLGVDGKARTLQYAYLCCGDVATMKV